MTKILGLLALLAIGCTSTVATSKTPAVKIKKPPVQRLSEPPVIPLPEFPKPFPPQVLLEPKPSPEPDIKELPGPRLVAAIAVLENGELLQCTELYGFSVLPFNLPEAVTSGVRLVPIRQPCRVQFKSEVIPAMCGTKVSDEVRQKSNMIWEQNYYFLALREDLGKLEDNCNKDGGAWWDEDKGGRYPDFLLVYPAPQQLEMF